MVEQFMALKVMTLVLVATLAPPVPAEVAAATPDEPDPAGQAVAESRPHSVVTTTADEGAGSLRQAILDADTGPGETTITFDPETFADPQTIVLKSPLPVVDGTVTIDGFIPDRLWAATGVTVSGDHRFPVFLVGRNAHVRLLHLTVADGCGTHGGGILNLGDLVVRGVTLRDNVASEDGGAIFNLGGAVAAINSTFADNRASSRGGGMAGLAGFETITNCTFSGNSAEHGGGVFTDGFLLLRNTMLVKSDGSADCVAATLHPASTSNIIEEGNGCGASITSADPRLGEFGGYNGPTMTFPLSGGSVAINLGDNASALDENGLRLVWDQRGNGDPRFVAGYTDIGAFEHQRFPHLTVDTNQDNGLRACTRAGRGDCPLRGALELANATATPDVITFDRVVFDHPTTLVLTEPLPAVTAPLTIDATSCVELILDGPGGSDPLKAADGIALELIGVSWESDPP